jgi:aromatic-L-amino-acid decarboxylase
MVVDKRPEGEITLDPHDWDEFQAISHQMVDDMLAYLKTLRERPLWKPIPDIVKEHFRQPLPDNPQDIKDVYREFVENILPYPEFNIHPRSWGWVIGTGTPVGMMADMLASGHNTGFADGEQARNYVELQILDWCKQMLGFPAEASGLVVSGCSVANIIGLTIARNTKSGVDMRRHGLQGLSKRMTLYASQEAHSSIQRAVELLGLGSEALRLIPVDEDFRINLDALQRAIQEDQAAGHQPFCVVGCAGTTSTGAIDDLHQLARICREQDLWFHVDGAFGALAALSPESHPLVSGMELADSLAFDMHKWLYMPYEVGYILVRHRENHFRTFAVTPDYLEHGDDNPVLGGHWFSDYGIELSTGFRALKVWFSMKTYGLATYGRLIQQNVEQARYLVELIGKTPQLELLAPLSLNVVCFRFREIHLDESELNQLNTRLLMQLQQGGVAMVSNTTIHGKYSLRAAITNHRSRRDDFDILVQEVVKLGNNLLKSRVQ